MKPRHTYHNGSGWGIKGIDIAELDDRVQACIWELVEYEDTNLSPIEIHHILDTYGIQMGGRKEESR